jgi:protein-L-isoaspartate(D-aspartate) O-methyltransferase
VFADDPRERLALALRSRVRDRRVLAALLDTPRDLYVGEEGRLHAWEDRALPFAEAQTVSQPTMVAIMTEALEPDPNDRVLDVGTGSGYQAAVLARLVRRVFGIELRLGLARRARASLARDPGVKGSVTLVVADGWRGFPGRIEFDGILVAAASDHVPEALVRQLAVGGRLLAPIGPPGYQELVRLRRNSDASLSREELGGCTFVPLVRHS